MSFVPANDCHTAHCTGGSTSIFHTSTTMEGSYRTEQFSAEATGKSAGIQDDDRKMPAVVIDSTDPGKIVDDMLAVFNQISTASGLDVNSSDQLQKLGDLLKKMQRGPTSVLPPPVQEPDAKKLSKKEILAQINAQMIEKMEKIFDRLCDIPNPGAKQSEDMLRVVLLEWDNDMTVDAVEDLLGRDPENPRSILGKLMMIITSFEQELYGATANPMARFVQMLRTEMNMLTKLLTGVYPRRSIFDDIAQAYARRKTREAKHRLFEILLDKLRKLNGHHAKIRSAPYLAKLADSSLKDKYLAMFAPVMKSISVLEKEAGVYAARPKERAVARGLRNTTTGNIIAKDLLTHDEIEIEGPSTMFLLHRSTRGRHCGFACPLKIFGHRHDLTAGDDTTEAQYRLLGWMTYLKSRFAIKLKRDIVPDRNYPRQQMNDLTHLREAEFTNFSWSSGRVPAGQCRCGQWVYLLNPRFLELMNRFDPEAGEAHRKEVMQLYNASMMARYQANGMSVVYSCINRFCPNAGEDIIDEQVIAEVEAREAKIPFNGLRGLRQCTHPDCMVEWCGICKASRYHTGPCPGPTKLAADLQEMFDKGEVRICPSCKQPCYKDSGECNSVTCKCTKCFCWRCGGDLNPTADHHHTCNEAVTGTEITDYGRYGFTQDTTANTKDPRNPNARSLEEAETSMKSSLGLPLIDEIDEEETKEELLVDSPEPRQNEPGFPGAPFMDRYPQHPWRRLHLDALALAQHLQFEEAQMDYDANFPPLQRQDMGVAIGGADADDNGTDRVCQDHPRCTCGCNPPRDAAIAERLAAEARTEVGQPECECHRHCTCDCTCDNRGRDHCHRHCRCWCSCDGDLEDDYQGAS